MPSSFFSKLRDYVVGKTPPVWQMVILFLLLPIEILVHEAGHILAAKHFDCFKSLKFSLWGRPYLFAVYTTRNETVSQTLLITLAGILVGFGFAVLSGVINPLWKHLVLLSLATSILDFDGLLFWYHWGKDNGFDRPVWHGPIGTWCDRKRFWHPLICVDVYEADDFPCYYDDD